VKRLPISTKFAPEPISDAVDGRLDARLGKPLGVADRDVLGGAILMVDQAAALDGPSLVKACSKASSTKPAWAVRETRQPTMPRAKVSMTKAT